MAIWAQIDAQIDVLENNLSEDDINNKYDNYDLNSTAYGTRLWMDGTGEDESPSEGWTPLVK